MIKKLTQRKYLSEFVYGSIDGTITTFAIVAGAVGASLSSGIILIMGFANLFADGFSMAVSNYLSTKSQEELETSHKHKIPHAKNPKNTAFATFAAFVLIGIVPLLPFLLAIVIPSIKQVQFLSSVILTAIAFLAIGAAKGSVIGKNKTQSALTTLGIGSVAAILAFFIGYFLRGLVA